MSDEGMKKGLLRPRAHAGKKGRDFEEEKTFRRAAFLSSHPQHLSQQASFAAILAAILKLLVILLWSVVGGQLLVNHRTSI